MSSEFRGGQLYNQAHVEIIIQVHYMFLLKNRNLLTDISRRNQKKEKKVAINTLFYIK